MKGWYKSPATKGILLLLAHVLAVLVVLSIVVNMLFSGNIRQFMKGSTGYENSISFKKMVYNSTWDVMEGIQSKGKFESDGKYNPDKLVDIVSLGKNRIIDGENNSGLAYRLEDLTKWSEQFQESESDNLTPGIVVCQRSDGTYFYYYMNEFKEQVQSQKLRLEIKDMSSLEFMERLEGGEFTSGHDGRALIRNEQGDQEYVDFWTFEDTLEEKYAPVGAENILDVVNKTPELNGTLSLLFQYLRATLNRLSSEVERYLLRGDMWEEGNTNLTYLYIDQNIKRVYTNSSKFKEYNALKENIAQIKGGKDNKYFILGSKLSEFDTNIDISVNEWQNFAKSFHLNQTPNYTFVASVNTKFPIRDSFYSDASTHNKYVPYLKIAAVGSIVGVVLLFIIFIWLTIIAGRTREDKEVHLNSFDRWKTEISAATVILLWCIPMFSFGNDIPIIDRIFNMGTTYPLYRWGDVVGVESTYDYASVPLDSFNLFVFGLVTIFTVGCFLIGYLSLVRRIKGRSVWKNSLLQCMTMFLKEIWENRTVVFKTVFLLTAFILIHWIGAIGGKLSVLVMLLSEGVVAYLVIKVAIAKDRIKKGIREISKGNVDYQIPMKHLNGESRVIAEMVNDIGSGLQRAVEDGMKSERLKTDLITNVSHDIKTPLTSIINYVALLKREHFEDAKVQGYLDVLETKAHRLKTLTEDVVEASKVSSGNITLEFMEVNLVEMINQTVGEFAEKFQAKELEIIQSLPDEVAVIRVDGKRMWRILENIYNNVAKYAMPGTRIYSDLWVSDGKVTFSLKNISQYPLNISADELTERFIRGDISRGTEGSGLGLSIAKSLTNMQQGDFQLYLDGDLFKVTIEFPRVK